MCEGQKKKHCHKGRGKKLFLVLQTLPSLVTSVDHCCITCVRVWTAKSLPLLKSSQVWKGRSTWVSFELKFLCHVVTFSSVARIHLPLLLLGGYVVFLVHLFAVLPKMCLFFFPLLNLTLAQVCIVRLLLYIFKPSVGKFYELLSNWSVCLVVI